MGRKGSASVTGTTKQARGNTGAEKKTREKKPKMSPQEIEEKYGIRNKTLNYKIKFTAKNEKQQALFDIIGDKEISLVKGSAGVGKSWVVFSKALQLLKESSAYDKIIVLIPTMPAEEIGFLPGTLEDKIFSATLADRSTIIKVLNQSGNNGEEVLESLITSGQIVFDCISYWRGRSIDRAIVCVSESSNLTPNNIKTAITRIENSVYVFSGDPEQSDLPLSRNGKTQPDGLTVAFEKLKDIEEIGKIIFTEEDEIVRNPIIRKILNAWKKE